MQKSTDTRLATFVAAFASLGAGLIHLAVTPDHWQEWMPSGVFFIGIALFQVLWGAAVLLFPRSGLVGLGVVANLGSMALWGASRVWGVPVGPNAGVPEAVGVSGVLTILLEAVAVVGALWFLLPREQKAILSTGGYRFALGGAVLVVAALTAPGTVAAFGHDHGSHGEGKSGHHSNSGASSEAGSHGKPGHHQDTPAPTGPSTSTETTPAPTGHTHPSQRSRQSTVEDPEQDGHPQHSH